LEYPGAIRSLAGLHSPGPGDRQVGREESARLKPEFEKEEYAHGKEEEARTFAA
jgi:hypothetical protein